MKQSERPTRSHCTGGKESEQRPRSLCSMTNESERDCGAEWLEGEQLERIGGAEFGAINSSAASADQLCDRSFHLLLRRDRIRYISPAAALNSLITFRNFWKERELLSSRARSEREMCRG